MTIYKESMYILPRELERINRLLDIPSFEFMTDLELENAGAEKDAFEGVFGVTFADGSTLTWDLCSGHSNYYDNVVWTSSDCSMERVLDCAYELDDIEFEAGGATYIVSINH